MGDEKGGLFVIGIGASAGGLEPIQEFFNSITEELYDTNTAYVVIQHLSPDFNSLMDQLLARKTQLKIKTISDNMPITKGTIFLIPPNNNVFLKENKFKLVKQQREQHLLNLPINIFFKSLADEYGRNAVAIVMSGTGSDGSTGIVNIKKNNGLVMVQKPELALFDGMPKSAIGTGTAEVISSVTQMPALISKYIKAPDRFKYSEEVRNRNKNFEGLDKIFKLIQERYKFDLSNYKPTTVLRRIERRVKTGGYDNIRDYAEELTANSNELKTLHDDLIIGVTSFFRDEDSYQEVKIKVIPELFKIAEAQSRSLRIWIPGCSTGEEVYSVAIIFNEFAIEKKLPFNIKIFATDIKEDYLKKAAAGLYSNEQAEKISPERLRKFFEKTSKGYRITNEIRNAIVFSPHNLILDPPFTNMDLISCKNLLIYLKPEIQEKLISIFRFSLNAPGYLVLGPSETLGKNILNMQVLSQKWKIYRQTKKSDRKLLINKMNERLLSKNEQRSYSNITEKNKEYPENTKYNPNSQNNDYSSLSTYHTALKSVINYGYMIDTDYNVVHIFGDAGEFLTFKEGILKPDIREVTHKSIRPAIRSGLIKAEQLKEKVLIENIKIKDEYTRKNLIIHPVLSDNSEIINHIIKIIDSGETETDKVVKVNELDDYSQQIISDYESKLQKTKEELSTTVEELETSNEELQSSNEELLASNEELQSTNEELHSVNEELYTVNSEHQEKIRELNEMTSDFQNLMKSTDFGIIFVDKKLNIKFYNPTVQKFFNFREDDIGRSIKNFSHNFNYSNFVKKTDEVIKNGTVFKKEIISQQYKYYILKILPYLTQKNKVDGAVITFIDIDEFKRSQGKLRQQAEKLSQAVDIAKMGIWEWDLQTYRFSWNPNMYNIFGRKEKTFTPTLLSLKKILPKSKVREFRNKLKATIKKKSLFKGETKVTLPGKHAGYIKFTGSYNKVKSGRSSGIIGVCFDITEEKFQENKFYHMVNRLPVASILVNRDGKVTYSNLAAAKLFNMPEKELKGNNLKNLIVSSGEMITILEKISNLTSEDEFKFREIKFSPATLTEELYCNLYLNRIKFFNSEFILFTIVDITKLVQKRQELNKQKQELKKLHSEYEKKIEEIHEKNIYNENAICNTDISFLFLDNDFRLKSYEGNIDKYISLREEDIGRKISELEIDIDDFELIDALGEFDQKKTKITKEVKLDTGNWVKINITGYYDNKKYLGYTVSFEDITRLKNEAVNAADKALNIENNLVGNSACTYVYDIKNETFIFDKGGYRILGLDQGKKTFTKDEITGLIMPHDKKRSEELLNYEKDIMSFDKKVEVTRTDKLPKTLLSRGYYYNKAHIRGLLVDISNEKYLEGLNCSSRFEECRKSNFSFDRISCGWFSWNFEKEEFVISPGLKINLGFEIYDIPDSFEGYKRLFCAEDLQKIKILFNNFKDYTFSKEFTAKLKMLGKDKVVKWHLVKFSNIIAPLDKTVGIIGAHTDITELKQNELDLKRQADFDMLTGLYNRNKFAHFLSKSILRKDRSYNIALLFIDIDGFKGINDTYGHKVGDEVIKRMGVNLKKIARKRDFSARLSGDEFGVLIEGYKDTKNLYEIAERYLNLIREPFEVKEIHLKISTSIGIAICSSSNMSSEELLRRADIAMYKAKQYGKNTYAFFDKELSSEIITRQKIEIVQREVINNKELSLLYQPVYNKKAEIIGAEALLRWNRREFKNHSIQKFIEIAESNGQIIPIGNWIMNKVFSDYITLYNRNNFKQFYFAINISAVQLFYPNFINSVKYLFDKNFKKIKPQIYFEITETEILKNLKEAKRIMNELTSSMNIEFSLDDFGTGYSSLLTLNELPTSIVKIDKSFIQNIENPKINSANIIKSIIKLVKSLKMQVLAEGVETKEQLDFMLRNNTDYIQGFYYSKPLALRTFEKLLLDKSL
ncbi:MAG: EAL domain-containing protein [Victivallales bacterium]|nr:EAL domain-containing protein [Victivallales bacterium]